MPESMGVNVLIRKQAASVGRNERDNWSIHEAIIKVGSSVRTIDRDEVRIRGHPAHEPPICSWTLPEVFFSGSGLDK